MNKIIITAGLCVALASCNQPKPANENADMQYKGDTLYVAEKSIVNTKLKIDTVKSQNYSAEFNTTGIVKAIAGQMVEIAPPFDGRIIKAFVQLGQKINAGTPVFELHAADFFDATKNYFQALQTKKMKELNFLRQKDLVKNGVGVVKELEEAETDYEVALKDYENASATLKMFNVRPEEITMGQALKVVSPIAGEVVQVNMVIGQYVKSDAAPSVIVAELSKVWVVAQVKEKYIDAIHPEDKVEIRTEANPDQVLIGHVSHISELLDEETRSVQVLITCDNKERQLKPGMFTAVHFINQPTISVLVPSAALLQTETSTYVFVKKSAGCYVKRMVKTTTVDQQTSLISEGLKAGEVIVAEGGIYLMAN